MPRYGSRHHSGSSGEIRGYAREGRDWLERTVALQVRPTRRGCAAAEFGLGKLSVELGD